MPADEFMSSVLKQLVFSWQTEPIAKIQKQMRTKRTDFIYAKTDITTTKRADELRALGFALVDELVTLEKPWPAQTAWPRVVPPYKLRWAEAQDEPAVVRLAQTAFQQSRFHNDPALSKKQANTIKAAWARNFFHGKRGEKMALVATGDTAVGFLQLLTQGDALVIDLIAIDTQHRGHGLGSALVAWAIAAWPTTPLKSIRVGTQERNPAALALYKKAGFAEVGRQLVWHWHRGE